MSHSKFLVSIAVAGILLVSACTKSWKTDYANPVDPQRTKTWRIVAVDVRVPGSLTVSEANLYAPNADIVWREDPLAAETDRETTASIRRQQVDDIMTKAVWRGTRTFSRKSGGTRPVTLRITMQRFHALSQKARIKLNRSGVHNITFSAQFVDHRTGTTLTKPERIDADLYAFVGKDAHNAEVRGQTQRVRISDHVANVINGWLGHGPDVRGTFIRRGK